MALKNRNARTSLSKNISAIPIDKTKPAHAIWELRPGKRPKTPTLVLSPTQRITCAASGPMLPPSAMTGRRATAVTLSLLPCVASASIARPETVTAEPTTPAMNLRPVKACSEVAKPMHKQQVLMPTNPSRATFLRPHLSATKPQDTPANEPKKYAHCKILLRNETSMSTHPVAEGTRTMICVESDEDMIASARNSM
jgi:hypothetical protein